MKTLGEGPNVNIRWTKKDRQRQRQKNGKRWQAYHIDVVDIQKMQYSVKDVAGTSHLLPFASAAKQLQSDELKPLISTGLHSPPVWFKNRWENTNPQPRPKSKPCAIVVEFVQKVENSCRFVTDAITGNVLELKSQTIFIRTRGKHDGKEKWNAADIAARLTSCTCPLDDKIKFDSVKAIWFEMGILVIARPGSGKTWMMQQVTHALCEQYLASDENSEKFVPLLFSVQRLARLYRTDHPSETGTEISSEAEAVAMLKLMLSWEYEEATVNALLECYKARTLIILLDGLDEASSLARTFETLGQFLCQSGNRIMMATRPEGIRSEEGFENMVGWSLLDLPELSLEQQSQIVQHQISSTDGPFFGHFFEFQKCRKLLDSAAENVNFYEGAKVEARFPTSRGWRKGKITQICLNGTYDIMYDDGDEVEGVSGGLINIIKAAENWTLDEGTKIEAQCRGSLEYYKGKIARKCLNGTYNILYDDGDEEKGVSKDHINVIVGGGNMEGLAFQLDCLTKKVFLPPKPTLILTLPPS